MPAPNMTGALARTPHRVGKPTFKKENMDLGAASAEEGTDRHKEEPASADDGEDSEYVGA